MKLPSTTLLIGILCFALFSCKHQQDLSKRKYTQGQYHDFSLGRDKSDKSKPTDSSIVEKESIVLEKVKEEILPTLTEMKAATIESNPKVMLEENYPVIAVRMDSVIARQMRKDSTWRTDTLPEAIATALSSQAMVGVGTVGGLLTIAVPEAIWFTIIPMIGIPFFLLISLIAAAIAMSKINSGEIDDRYRKWMKLWAVCLLLNLILGAIVLLHFTA